MLITTKKFHSGDLLWDTEGYFKFGNYCDSIIDVIIIPIAKALHMNLSIYENGRDENMQVIEQTTDVRGREVHLKFMWDPQNTSHKDHDAILWFVKSGEVFYQDEHDLDRPSPTRQQMKQLHHDCEVIDLTDNSDITPMQQDVYFPYYWNDMQFPTYLLI